VCGGGGGSNVKPGSPRDAPTGTGAAAAGVGMGAEEKL
jgi:hypothetical protein